MDRKRKPEVRAVSLALVLLITGSAMACTAVLIPSPAPGGLPATSPAPLPTRAVPTDTRTRAPLATPTPALMLISPEDETLIPGDQRIVLVWRGPALTDRQRFIVEVAGRELELQGPQPGPEFRYSLLARLPGGRYTWRVRLEEEGEGKWEVVARSGERQFRVLLSPTPSPTRSPTSSPTPSPTPPECVCEWDSCECCGTPLPCPPPTEPWSTPTVTCCPEQ